MCQDKINDAVIILGGELNGTEAAWLVEKQFVVAVDHGADHAYKLGVRPDLLLGDMDSLHQDTYKWCVDNGVQAMKYPTEKDYTDGELAFFEVQRRKFKRLVVLAAWGGRQDHQLANLLLAARFMEDFVQIILPGDNFCAQLCCNGYKPQAAQGQLISLICLSEVVEDICTTGLCYPLTHESLYFGQGRGLSNVLEDAEAQITFGNGRLLMIQYKKLTGNGRFL